MRFLGKAVEYDVHVDVHVGVRGKTRRVWAGRWRVLHIETRARVSYPRIWRLSTARASGGHFVGRLLLLRLGGN